MGEINEAFETIVSHKGCLMRRSAELKEHIEGLLELEGIGWDKNAPCLLSGVDAMIFDVAHTLGMNAQARLANSGES